MKSANEQQIEAERAVASDEESRKAAEKRAAASGVESSDEPVEAKPKVRKQTTRTK